MAKPTFSAFGAQPLTKLLDIKVPPLSVGPRKPLRQLEYIERYLTELKCTIIAIEEEYIDRDYMEDHSVFYARSLAAYPNSCKRVHFFRDHNEADLKDCIRQITDLLRGKNRAAYRDACNKFSEAGYLGFMVLKPLHGCPVGRTVLRTYPTETETGELREFRGSRPYHAHLLGVKLTVNGLAFQQQDEGVSACATTAIWSSLQKLRDVEELSATTPAQITILASRFALPFGRPMPSEGLNIDQMCQSIHALSISPDLVRASRYDVARGIIYSSALSETAPILIIQHPKLGCHAVTVAGIKRLQTHVIAPAGPFLDDRAADLTGLYVHDDRIGPNVKAHLGCASQNLQQQLHAKPEAPQVTITKPDGTVEEWLLTHILTPVHSKVRLSFSQMRSIAIRMGGVLKDLMELQKHKIERIGFGVRILRAPVYIAKIIAGSEESRSTDFFSQVVLSRYVGLIHLEAGPIGPFEALIDTTGTPRNARCLAIINRGDGSEPTDATGRALADVYRCCYVA